MRFFAFLLLVLGSSAPVFAQEINYPVVTALPFLRIPAFPSLSMNGAAFTGLPTSDINGLFINPAQIGNFAAENQFGSSFGHADWLSWNDYEISTAVIGYGGRFHRPSQDFKLSYGVAFSTQKLNLGIYENTDNEGYIIDTRKNFDRARGVTAGIQYEKGLVVNLGISVRRINSFLSIYEGKVWSTDLGVLISKSFTFQNIRLSPSMGLSVVNMGKGIIYSKDNPGDPLPKTARLGFGLTADIRDNYSGVEFSTLKADISVEGRELLVYRNDAQERFTQRLPSHMSLYKHFIRRRSDALVEVHQGFRIQIMETVRIGLGNYDGAFYYNSIHQRGIEFSSEGVFRYLGAKNPSFNKTLQRINVLLSYVEFNQNDSDLFKNTRILGVTVQVKR